MYNALAVGNHVDVEIAGPKEEFELDLDAFKACINPADRKYDKERKVWTVSNPERYAGCVIYLKRALEQKKMQLELFP